MPSLRRCWQSSGTRLGVYEFAPGACESCIVFNVLESAERLSALNYRTLLARCDSFHYFKGFIRMHLRAMEYQGRVLLPEASADKGEAVTQMCNVIDVGDLSLYETVSNSGVLAALRAIAAIDQDYYPENLGVTLVCNAPWSFTTAWGIVKMFLDTKTQQKFVVLGKGKAGVAELEKILGAGKVPAFLGGTCKCDGGCVSMDPVVGPTERVMTNAQMMYAKFHF